KRINQQLDPQRDRGKRVYRECLWQIKWNTDSSPPTTISIYVGCRKTCGRNVSRLDCASAARASWRMKKVPSGLGKARPSARTVTTPRLRVVAPCGQSNVAVRGARGSGVGPPPSCA